MSLADRPATVRARRNAAIWRRSRRPRTRGANPTPPRRNQEVRTP